MTRHPATWIPGLRRRWVVILTLVLLVAGTGALAVYLWERHHLRAAHAALARDDLGEAQRHLDLCLKVRPGSADLHLLAARTARRRDAYEEAERHLAAAGRSGDRAAGVALERSLLRAQRGDLEPVGATLRELVRAGHPDSALILEASARGLLKRFREADAIRCLDALLKREPENARAYLLRAKAWASLDRKEESRRHQRLADDYQRAVDLEPDLIEARLGLAAALAALGRTAEAVGHYEWIRRRSPSDPEALLGLARARHDLHEPDEARRLLDDLLAAHPDHVAGLVERGRLLVRGGHAADAEVWLRKAVAGAPASESEPLRVLLWCLEAQGKEAEALVVRDRLRRVEADVARLEGLILAAHDAPQDVDVRLEIGRALQRFGRDDESVSWFYGVLEIDPHQPAAHAALAEYFERAGQPARAARHHDAGRR